MKGVNRSRMGLAVIVALIGAFFTLALAAPAGAFHTLNPSRNDQWDDQFADDEVYQGFDPMETSVPYVAWRGEEVRLVKCFDREYFEPREHGDPDEGGVPIVAMEADETGEWAVMDWSGDDHVWPQFFDDNDRQTRVFFPYQGQTEENDGDQSGRGCFAIDITSHKPGIAVVKLKIDDEGSEDGGVGDDLDGEGDPVAAHQFNVIWMSFQDARLRCLESEDTDGCPGLGPVHDPIVENPGDTNRLGVVVQGRIPLNEEFTSELNAQLPAALRFPADSDGESAAIFPEDYPVLAQTSLAHISWPLQKANNGREGDDNYNNLTCVLSPDNGDLDDPDPYACASDVGTSDYVPEPRHTAGDFWDIHDSTGPYNTDVYGPNKPLIDDVCPVPPTGVPDEHNEDCHVDQHDDFGGRPLDTMIGGGGDRSCDDGDPDGAGGPDETVDNCDEGEFDSFSRVFHDVSGEDDEATIGPYSPTRPDETVLSDGLLNAHDAPMPSALVIASIAGDADTIGHLEAVDKHVVYNRGGIECSEDNQDDKHCVTGPFSGAYIPASPTMENNPAEDIEPGSGDNDDSDVASGVHGTIANNFNGYLPVYYPERQNRGLYHYWDIVETGDELVGVYNGCRNPGNGGFYTPSGLQELWLYTDEHGEAQFRFDAGTGFFFDPEAEEGDGVPFLNSQDGCVPTGELGTAEISVNARYPFQPTTSAGTTSNILRKRVVSLFDKGIVCVPKRGEVLTKAICVVFARNIDGTPLDELVCVGVTGSNNVTVRDFFIDDPSLPQGGNPSCVDTDDIGVNLPDDLKDDILAAAPFLNSSYGTDAVLIIGQGSHLVTADFLEEFIEVQVRIAIPAGSTNGTSTGQGTGITPNAQPDGAVSLPNGAVLNNNETAGSSSNKPSGGSNPSAKRPAVQKKASLVFVRIVKQLKLGLKNRYVVVRVKSPQKNARVQLKLINKRGKVMGSLMRKIKTNRNVKVPNLRLPKAVVTVRAKVIA